MFDAQVIAFTIVATALTLTPGADTFLVLRNVLRGSRKDGIITTFGICSGLFVHAVFSALGVSVILMHSALAFQLVKTAGACYLIWLGLQSLRHAFRQTGQASIATESNEQSHTLRQCFWEGFLNNLLNPKVVVFYLAFLPQFIGPDDSVLQKSMLLAGIHYTLGIVWLVSLSVGVDRARQFMTRASIRRWLDGLCGAVLMGLGIRLVLEKR